MTNKDNEMILAFEKEALDETELTKDLLAVPVLAPADFEDYKDMIDLLNGLWDVSGVVKRRGDLEEDNNYIQPIPAIVIARGDEYFAYTRLEGSGEKRLHNMSSITVGGHANNEQHWNFEHLLAINGARELEEEIYILDENGDEITNHFELMKESVIFGLGYNNKTEVDAVHFAIYYMLVIPDNWDVKVKETDTLDGEFKTLEEIKKMNLENWSKMALSVLK